MKLAEREAILIYLSDVNEAIKAAILLKYEE